MAAKVSGPRKTTSNDPGERILIITILVPFFCFLAKGRGHCLKTLVKVKKAPFCLCEKEKVYPPNIYNDRYLLSVLTPLIISSEPCDPGVAIAQVCLRIHLRESS